MRPTQHLRGGRGMAVVRSKSRIGLMTIEEGGEKVEGCVLGVGVASPEFPLANPTRARKP